MSERPLYIPVILGTTRQGRMSEHVARFVHSEVQKRPDVETELIDIREMNINTKDAGAAVKDPKYADQMTRADGLVIVSPEYNHGYPGMLKHVLDSCLEEYVHKAVAICGVSAGGFGGTRVIENMLSVMRELGLVTIFWDGNFSTVQNVFDDQGNLKDQSYIKKTNKFLSELIWMSKVLRYGRENITRQ
ncbi:MAG TPA: NAD(P)H-dependent oxidoreductase [Acidobacteriota bacterium]|jgi:NAD(P)H-dependent FMN reductase|nr:NAD(P)H-dependent oxidoreductase [Acidobacteriota bacterium]